jgi:hypothetical protein
MPDRRSRIRIWATGGGAEVGSEIVSLRDAFSSTFVADDGLLRSEVSPEPVNVEVGGEWLPILDNWVADPQNEGGYRNERGSFDALLPPSLPGEIVVDADGVGLVSSLRNATGSLAVDGYSATYADAFENVDLVYELAGPAVRE